MLSPRSSPVRSSPTLSSCSLILAQPPKRRPSAEPSPAATLARRNSVSRTRRHSSSKWRSNTYSGDGGTDEFPEVQVVDGTDCCRQRGENGGGANGNSGRKLPSSPTAKTTTTTTILCLREAMRELARPQMQLCFFGTSPSGSGGSSLSVSAAAGAKERRSSGDKCSSSISAPSIETGTRQQQQTMTTLGTAATTTRSASVCYPSCAQQISRRCSTTTRSGRLERSNSLVAGRGSSTLAFLPDLNPQQVANLRRTWKHINTKGLYDIIRRSFRKVESSNSAVAMAFRQCSDTLSSATAADGTKHWLGKTTENNAGGGGNVPSPPPLPQTKNCGVMEHSKYFMMLLNRIIDGDNHQEDLARELRQIGARHVIVYKRFGVGVTAIERTGEALAESFFKLDGIRQSKETTKVWRVLIAKIIDHIETGFKDELRSQRRQTSSALLSSAAGALAAPFFESKFIKRNSVPTPRDDHKSVRSASNEEDGNTNKDDYGGSPPAQMPSSSSTASPTSPSAPSATYHQQQHLSAAASDGCFLRAELAGVVRRLSNM